MLRPRKAQLENPSPQLQLISKTTKASLASRYVSPYKQTREHNSKGAKQHRLERAKLKPVASHVLQLMERVRNSPSLSTDENRLKMTRKLPVLRQQRRKIDTFTTTYGIEDDASVLSNDSFGMASSQRSLGGGGGSLGGKSLLSRMSLTSYASHSDVSLRAMVADIEHCARNHLDAPDYVPFRADLPLSLVSWKANMTRRAVSSSKIDIIPCHQSLQLLMSKAHERSSKLQKVLDVKQSHEDDHQRLLLASINSKMNRADLAAAALQVRQMQAAWLKVIVVMRYLAVAGRKFAEDRIVAAAKKKKMKAATTLAFFFNSIVSKKVKLKLTTAFSKAGKYLWRLLIGIKVFRKRMAVRKIVDFLRSFKGNQRIKIVIHRFVQSAHLLQCVGRSFNACNMARLHTICKVWDALEMKYIINKLQERRRLEHDVMSKSSAAVVVDAKMLIEMNKQNEKWRNVDAQMERAIQKHRFTGMLPPADSLFDLAKSKVLPWDIKKRALQKYIQLRRKAFVLLRGEILNKKRKKMESFTPDDAHDLLHNRTANIDNIIKTKFLHNHGEKNVPGGGFLLFKDIDKSALAALVERVHEAVGTFTIVVRKRGVKSLTEGSPGTFAIHPQILAARKAKEEAEKQKEKARVFAAIDSASNAAVSLVSAKLVIHEKQRKRRGGVQLQVHDVL